MGDVPDHYWKNLLAITTKVSSEHETVPSTSTRELKPMSDEDRKWLEQVMADLVNDTDLGKALERTLNALKCLSTKNDLNEADLQKLKDLVLRLDDLIQYADLTPYFIREGGLALIERFLLDEVSVDLQIRFAETVLTLAENNPPAQDAIIEHGLLDKLLTMLSNPKFVEKLRLKILGAISGTVRSHPPSFDRFCALDGPARLTSLVADANTPLHVAAKAARVLTSIAYTLADSETCAKALNVDVARNYVILVGRDRSDEAASEREYIREYLQQSVEWDELDEQMKDAVIRALRSELEHDRHEDTESSVQRLIRKYCPHKCG